MISKQSQVSLESNIHASEAVELLDCYKTSVRALFVEFVVPIDQ